MRLVGGPSASRMITLEPMAVAVARGRRRLQATVLVVDVRLTRWRRRSVLVVLEGRRSILIWGRARGRGAPHPRRGGTMRIRVQR